MEEGRRLNRWVLRVIAGILGTLLLGVLGLSRIPRWLVLDEELARSDAIIVLGGHVPVRAMEAARLYREGWAPEVWITQPQTRPEDEILRDLGVDAPAEARQSQQVLLRLGVPAEAIVLLEPPVANTYDEVIAVSGRLRATGGRRAIFVSSKAHTRRIQVTWRALTGGSGLEARVRSAKSDQFDAQRWWSNSEDALTVTKEIGGIVNAWAGFPLRPRSPESKPQPP